MSPVSPQFTTVFRRAPAPVAVFIVDAGVSMGGGHVARSLRLARAMKLFGWRTIVAPVVPDGEDAVNMPELCGNTTESMDIEVLPSIAHENLPGAVAQATGSTPHVAVFDGYTLGKDQDQGVDARTRIAIDDLDRPHMTDGVLDQSPGKTPAAYTGTCPKADLYLVGVDYALINPALRRPLDKDGSSRSRVLISAGMIDAPGLAARALDELVASSRPLNIRILVGAQSPWRQHLEDVAGGHQGVEAITDCFDLTPHYHWCDVALGAGGVSLLERCCASVPSVTVPTADNQRQNIAALSGAATLVLKSSDELQDGEIADAVFNLLDNPDDAALLSANGARLVDGLGTMRATLAILNRASERAPSDISLRQMEDADLDATYEWQVQPGNRQFFLTTDIPREQDHRHWFHSRLSANDRGTFVVTAGDHPIGMVQLGPVEDDGTPVSIILDHQRQGQGYGSAALSWLAAVCGGTLKARIRTDNIASRRAFTEAGFCDPSAPPGLIGGQREADAS